MFRKLSKRWAVQLSTQEQLRRIPEDHVELSTKVQGDDGKALLMYRDSFTAFKAANYAGARVLSGYISLDDGHDYPSAMRLESGELLRLNIPLDVGAPQSGGMM